MQTQRASSQSLPLSVLVVLAALVPVAGLAQSRRVITHEDLWLMPRVSAPVVSPDGRHAVFLLTEPVYKSDEQSADLWIVPTDASAAPRRLTSTRAAQSGARADGTSGSNEISRFHQLFAEG